MQDPVLTSFEEIGRASDTLLQINVATKESPIVR
jgi:hypothetical protein